MTAGFLGVLPPSKKCKNDGLTPSRRRCCRAALVTLKFKVTYKLESEPDRHLRLKAFLNNVSGGRGSPRPPPRRSARPTAARSHASHAAAPDRSVQRTAVHAAHSALCARARSTRLPCCSRPDRRARAWRRGGSAAERRTSGVTRTSERRERRTSWPGEERGARAGRGRSGPGGASGSGGELGTRARSGESVIRLARPAFKLANSESRPWAW